MTRLGRSDIRRNWHSPSSRKWNLCQCQSIDSICYDVGRSLLSGNFHGVSHPGCTSKTSALPRDVQHISNNRMKRQSLAIETDQDTAPPDNVDPMVFRERISNLRELVDDLRQRAEDVTCTLEGFGLFGVPPTLPIGARELDFYSEVRRFEIFLIRNALRLTKGSQVKAARLLKMHETTLNSKLKSFNIDHRDYAIAVDGQNS